MGKVFTGYRILLEPQELHIQELPVLTFDTVLAANIINFKHWYFGGIQNTFQVNMAEEYTKKIARVTSRNQKYITKMVILFTAEKPSVSKTGHPCSSRDKTLNRIRLKIELQHIFEGLGLRKKKWKEW